MSSLAESCPDLPNCIIARQLENSQNNIRFISISHHAKLIMDFPRKFETTELRTFSITMKFLKGWETLFHQMFVNVQSFCIC